MADDLAGSAVTSFWFFEYWFAFFTNCCNWPAKLKTIHFPQNSVTFSMMSENQLPSPVSNFLFVMLLYVWEKVIKKNFLCFKVFFGPKCGRKVAVTKNLVAVEGPQVAVVLGWSGSEGFSGPGNPALRWSRYRHHSFPFCHLLILWYRTSLFLAGA